MYFIGGGGGGDFVIFAICDFLRHASKIKCFPSDLLSKIVIFVSFVFNDVLAILSASSLPWIPTCAGIHINQIIIPTCCKL